MPMNKKLLIILSIVAVLVVIVLAFVLFRPSTSEPNENDGFWIGGDAPSNGSDTPSDVGAVVGFDGTPVPVRDFVNNGVTQEDTVNPGTYFIAGSAEYCTADGKCPHGADTDRYTITYSKEDDWFSILLNKEPLGEVRREAESYLLLQLGITEQQACALNYQVATLSYVSRHYADKELRFSFCPGAVPLP